MVLPHKLLLIRIPVTKSSTPLAVADRVVEIFTPPEYLPITAPFLRLLLLFQSLAQVAGAPVLMVPKLLLLLLHRPEVVPFVLLHLDLAAQLA